MNKAEADKNWRCIRTITSPPNGDLSVVISHDSETLISTINSNISDRDNQIEVWQLSTGEQLGSISETSSYIAISPDGNTFAVGSFVDSIIRIYRLKTLQQIGKVQLFGFGVVDKYSSFAFSPNWQTVVYGGRRPGCYETFIKVWQLATGRLLFTLPFHDNEATVGSIAISSDSEIIAAASGHSSAIQLWQLTTGKALPIIYNYNKVFCFAMSPDGKSIACESEDRITILWELSTGDELLTLDYPMSLTAIAFSPDGKILATSDQHSNTVSLWQLSTKKKLQTLTGHSGWVFSIAFSQDGQTIVTGSRDKGRHSKTFKTFKIWRFE